MGGIFPYSAEPNASKGSQHTASIYTIFLNFDIAPTIRPWSKYVLDIKATFLCNLSLFLFE